MAGENIMKEKGSVIAAGELEPWTQLQDKIVMVTGASSGIGREFCLDLAEAGCRIVAAARRIDNLKSLCDEINARAVESGRDSTRAVAVVLDIGSDAAAVEAAIDKAWAAFGRIDALVNNAGIRGSIHNPLDLKEEEWNDIVKTNLTGTWLVSKYVCRRMRDSNHGGSVVNISSIAGLERGHLPGGLVYNCTKAAVNTMTKTMALELGVYNIRVNSISPGLFKSEITQGLVQKEWLQNVIRKTTPLRTAGSTNPAMTSLLRYLIHDSSRYINGNIFIIDAGATLPGTPIFSSL